MQTLILHELGHVSLFLLALLTLKLTTKKSFNRKTIIYGLAITLLIDIDHLFDYFLSQGFNFNLALFASGGYFHLSGKIFVLLHSWELVLVLFIISVFAKAKGTHQASQLLFITALALFAHLIFDTLYYNFNPMVYFLTYRLFHQFTIEIFI